MTQATCAALAAIFPIILLTVAIEGRLVTAVARRKRFYRFTVFAGLFGGLWGLILTVAGVQGGGLGAVPSFFAWLASAVAGIGLTFLLMLIMASDEVELEEIDAVPERPSRLELLREALSFRRR